ncbi:amidohydrolase family protein [Streptomyces sp. SAS_276]|uniref:amidohydrolase family protein n=1 Tax=Streptomyces sp. SAS_276 TaxID=3412745 RepID=UPI00403D4640
MTTHDVLDFATLQGARTNGLGDVTGSLTVGKKAGLLVVQAEDINNTPLAVFVDGQPRKWDGQVLDVNLPNCAPRSARPATTCSTHPRGKRSWCGGRPGLGVPAASVHLAHQEGQLENQGLPPPSDHTETLVTPRPLRTASLRSIATLST